MPKKSKDEAKLEIVSEKKETKKKSTAKKEKNEIVKKNVTAKEKKSSTSKATSKKATEPESKKKSTTKVEKAPIKPESKKKSTSSAKKTATAEKKNAKSPKDDLEKIEKKKETKSKKSTSKTSKTAKSKKAQTSAVKVKKQIELIEYYDLPYSYNKTVIKLLAQTPTSLFVYFEVSDEDKRAFISQYGENFFNETKPILIVHNETMNYTFEVEINDFANCWYFHVNDAKCKYEIKLARKYINSATTQNSYIYVTSSNELESPNNHILFNNINNMIYLKNVKTNEKKQVKISDISSIQNIGKIYNIYDLYKKLYSEENIEDFDLNNPSSVLPSSSFKI